MADLIIRGMAMPKSCDECRLFNECWCMALGIDDWRKSYNKPPQGERLPDCPLVPLPEGHGRLIDADALIRDKSVEATLWCGYEYQDHFVVFEEDIKNAPTIVPAEGGNADGV